MSIKTLDIGCGEGKWLKENGGRESVGTDVNLSRIKSAIESNKDISFVISDARCLPFKDKSFENIHIVDVLHHIKDFDTVFDEIYRISNGNLEIAETVSDNILFNASRKLMKSWKGDPIRSLFTSSQLEDKIAKNFVIDNIYCYTHLPIFYIFFYFRIENEIIDKINKIYNDILDRLRLSKYLITRVRIIGHNK